MHMISYASDSCYKLKVMGLEAEVCSAVRITSIHLWFLSSSEICSLVAMDSLGGAVTHGSP